MKRFFTLTVSVLALSGLLLACGGGGGSNGTPPQDTSKVQLSGTISNTDYSITAPAMKALAAFGINTPAYAAAVAPVVDQVLAIPMVRGTLQAGEMTTACQRRSTRTEAFLLLLQRTMTGSSS